MKNFFLTIILIFFYLILYIVLREKVNFLFIGGILAIILLKNPKFLYMMSWIVMFSFGPAFPVGIKLFGIQVNLTDFLLLFFILTYIFHPSRHKLNRKFNLITILIILLILLLIVLGFFSNSQSSFFSDLRLVIYCLAFLFYFSYYIEIFGIQEFEEKTIKAFGFGAIGALIKYLLIINGILVDFLSKQIQTLNSTQLGASRVTFIGADTLSIISLPFFYIFLLSKNNKKNGLLTFLPFAICIFFIAITYTRIDWISAIIGLILTTLLYSINSKLSKEHKRIYFFTIMMLILLFPLINFPISGSNYTFGDMILRRFSGDPNIGGPMNLNYRVSEIKGIIATISDNYLLGKGIGGEFYFHKFGSPYSSLTGWVHSAWGWVLLKAGFLGLLITIIGFTYTLILIYKKILEKKFQWDDHKLFFVGLFASLLSFLVMNITNNRFASIEGIFFLVFCFTYIDATYRKPPI